MAVQTSISTFFKLRAFLVFAALLSLCVSNNVGPCFLPLPVVTDHVAENQHEKQCNTASRHPSPVESDSFRVPMMAQTQKRADKPPQPQTLAATLTDGFVFQDNARAATEFDCHISVFTSASVLQPPGRASPRLA